MPNHTHRIKSRAIGVGAAFALLIAGAAPAAQASSIQATVSDETPYVGEVITVTVSGQNDGVFPLVDLYSAQNGDCTSTSGIRYYISSQRVPDGAFSTKTTLAFPEEGSYALCFELTDGGTTRGQAQIVATESPDCVDARSEYKTAKLKADAAKRKIKQARTARAKAAARKRYNAAVKVQRAALRRMFGVCPRTGDSEE